MTSIDNAQRYNVTHTLLIEILDSLSSVDFYLLAAQDGMSKGGKVTKKQKIVFVIDVLIKQVRIMGWGLCKHNSSIYVYNGRYWERLDTDEFKRFLGDVAWKMGVRWTDAKFYLFQEELFLQFVVSASLHKALQSKNVTVINLQNGTFTVTPKGLHLKAFSRADGLTYQLPFDYAPDANCPKFMAYLNRVLPEKTLQSILSEYIGYVFVRHLNLAKCLLLFGAGANGKSVFFNIIDALLGEENISHFSLDNLGHEHNRALLMDKLLNYGSEIKGSIHIDLFKQLVSGEPVQCRRKYENSFMLKDIPRLIFNCNELPREVEHTEAFFRRFLIIPFTVIIPEEERNPNLAKEIIQEELSGVFNWVLQGVQRLLTKQKFTESEVVGNAVAEYKQQSDSVFQYLDENGYQKDINGFQLIKFLYPQYRKYCSDNGYSPLNKINFKKRLINLSFEVQKRNIGNGVCLSVQQPASNNQKDLILLGSQLSPFSPLS